MTVKLGIGSDGRQIPISERIALALKLKREQERSGGEAGTDAVDDAQSSDVGSRSKGRREKSAADGGGSAVDDSVGAGSQPRSGSQSKASQRSRSNTPASESGSGAGHTRNGLQHSQRDNFELFRSKIAQARQQRGGDKDKEGVGKSVAGSSLAPTERGSAQESRAPELQRGDADSADLQGDEEGDFADYASPELKRTSKKKDKGPAAEGDAANEAAEAPAAVGENTADWIECFDPRSRRKYYYSAALKKSTWVRPPGYSKTSARTGSPATTAPAEGSALNGSAPVLATMNSGMPTRYASPLAPSRKLQHDGWGDAAAQSTAYGSANRTRPLVQSQAASSTRSSHDPRSGSPAVAPRSSAEALYSNGADSPFAAGASFTTQSSASDYTAIFTSPQKGTTPRVNLASYDYCCWLSLPSQWVNTAPSTPSTCIVC
jgi:hypothetical protein